jgi:hypothetical protein
LADGSVEPSSVSDIPSAAEIALFPNPSNGNITIQLPKAEQINSLRVMDVNGKLVAEQSVSTSLSVLSADWNLPAGTYLLQLQFDGGVVTKKLLVY